MKGQVDVLVSVRVSHVKCGTGLRVYGGRPVRGTAAAQGPSGCVGERGISVKVSHLKYGAGLGFRWQTY